MPVSPFDSLLAEVRQIDGFVLGCLIDASTGMVLGSVQEQEEARLPVAAAGAADVARVISLMTGELAANGGLEDAIITLTGHYHLIRQFSPAPRLRFLLLVVLDRSRANLAMAHRELRDFDMSFAGRADSGLPRHYQSV
ncbi:hypothetical protein N5079_00435 [Planotetraspora sp. A-T 1434]|uniref:hypothetical protein n=1 Tax=Planotetraspora sp. A-T 1434 TaxID=2979219 RepID=UPI0021C0BF44|nr:hypothetical protein [Planotetraspora sp. A-T 1434]MCT9928677.1 hypothetical protein [Planotetraspora sp. A-T 1434]